MKRVALAQSVESQKGARPRPEAPRAAPLTWHALFAAVLFGAYALLILWHRNPPSLTDLGNWTYQGDLLARHLRGLPDPAHTMKLFPVPNSAITVGIGLLCLVMPWVWACKVWLLLYLALAWWTLWSVVRCRPGSELLWILAPATVFLNVNFWYGFFNFQVGLCFLLLLLATVLRQEARAWLFGLLLLLTFSAHMIPFAFAATVVFLYAIQSRRYRLLWQLVPSGMVTVAYLFGRFVLSRNVEGSMRMISPVRTYSPAFWAYKVNSLLKSGGFVNPGSTTGSVALALSRPFFCLALAADVLLCALVVWMGVSQLRAALAKGRQEAVIWWAVLLFLPVYLLAPGEALGVSDPGSRVLQVLLAVALALLGQRRFSFRVAAFAALTLAFINVALFASAAYPVRAESTGSGFLPHPLVTLGHVPNHDQDMFYRELQRGNFDLAVFPTGMMINTGQARDPVGELPSPEEKRSLRGATSGTSASVPCQARASLSPQLD